jgi:hypothetical protein
MKRDIDATAERKFVERKSHVTKDGREVLYKIDWQRRVQELRQRCGGRCEYMIPLANIRCSREAADPHHIKLRSRGRDDRLSNLLAVCRYHHGILDAIQRKERFKR